MVEMLQADALNIPLADGVVQTVVTSPPYYSLRDYGVKGQIGLEQTPAEYVEKLVAVFRECWRVMKDDATLWLNLGDSYGGGNGGNNTNSEKQKSNRGTQIDPRHGEMPKQLLGIPWRVAFALQADGWYLRSDIIWAKPNPMPESVTDRPTKSHEYIFLLSKQERYYYNAEAIKEKGAGRELFGNSRSKGFCEQRQDNDRRDMTPTENRNRRSVWTVATQPYAEAHFATFPPKLIEPCILAGSRGPGKRCDCDEIIYTPIGEGSADDPTIYTGRAGMNRERRPNEGTRPITRREQRAYAEQMRNSPYREKMEGLAGKAFEHYIRTDPSGARPLPPLLLNDWLERGWLYRPDPCNHPIEQGDIVLDPFAGSGTTLAVADKHHRHAVGLDLKRAYIDLAHKRLAEVQPVLFNG